MENNNGSLRILGSGSSSGGVFNKVAISGAGEINGDIKCDTFKINGSGEMEGNLQAVLVKVRGASKIRGNIFTEDIIVMGASDIKGDVNCKYGKLWGAVDIRGNLAGNDIDISGAIRINGNCEAENFNGKGAIDIKGLLNAGEVSIDIKDKCEVKEIGGEIIEIKKAKTSIFEIMFNKNSGNRYELVSDSIEGDEVYLEYTTAKVVRGNKIVIGPGCNIECVEYREDFKSLKDSTVIKKRQI